MKRDKLLILNLEMDLNSRVLASAHDWVEAFAHHYSKVIVYATHVGKVNLPNNVVVVEVGGGNFLKRVRAIAKLFKSLVFVFRCRHELHIFHHMSSRTVAIIGPIIRLLNVPQILWYSHSKADWALKLFQFVPNKIVSSSEASVPILNTKKVRAIGHGIKVSRFDSEESLLKRTRSNMVALGRIVPIKNLEDALDALVNLDQEKRATFGKFQIIGPSELEPDYERKIVNIARTNNLNVQLLEPLDYAKIPELLATSSILFSGTPLSVDKVCLEAAMSGCIVVSKNLNVLKLTGLDRIYPNDEVKNSVFHQLDWLSRLKQDEEVQIRREIIRRSRDLNSLNSLVHSLQKIFEEIE